MAFIALNSLLVLPTRAAQRAAVRSLADHLGPGGLAVVDVWLPDGEDLARFDGPDHARVAATRSGDRGDRDQGRLGATRRRQRERDPDHDLRGGRAGRDPSSWLRRDRLRLVSADELRGYAEDAGLTVEAMAGGYDMGPMGPGSERAILLAVKP
jgi:hypothetical protein